MSIDFQTLPHEGIRHLKPYKPGKPIDELAKEQGLSDIIKLASNENPLGCSPNVRQIMAELSSSLIASYPAPLIHPIIRKLAGHLSVQDENILISNGSDFIYGLLISSFALHTNKHMLTHDYAFSTYEIQARALGVPVKSVAVDTDWQVNIDALITACNKHTGLICLANPNNPTGRLISKNDIKRLIDATPQQTLIVLDEAYFEFSYEQQGYNAIDWLADHPNLVLTRTFSKAYGLAGLRLGYAIAHPSIIDILRRLQLPFTVNQAALEAASVALDDQNFVNQSLVLNRQGMQQMSEGLNALGLDFIPSACNFYSFNCLVDAMPIYQQLLSQGIIVRPLHPYGMSNYLRVSIGTKEQNTRFLNALRGIFND